VTGDPTVTVLMAVHDGERHLRESIESILGQTFRDFELLVVDDASTDGTAAVLAGYDDPRIRTIRNPENLGLTRSLNRGLEQARGRLVARQDADDVSEPRRLERQVAFLEANPDVPLVASAYVRIDDSGAGVGPRPVPCDPRSIRRRLLLLNAFAHSSVVFRREAVEALGGYREEFPFAQDYDLWSRLARTAPLGALPEPLVRYREAAGSMTTDLAPSVDDVDRVSRDNIRRLGGDGERLARTIDREAAWLLLLAGGDGLGRRRAARAARDLLALERAFARREGIGRRSRLALAFQLVRALARARRD
jgi:glycosyltransferase involved in cell wall biosynthesis